MSNITKKMRTTTPKSKTIKKRIKYTDTSYESNTGSELIDSLIDYTYYKSINLANKGLDKLIPDIDTQDIDKNKTLLAEKLKKISIILTTLAKLVQSPESQQYLQESSNAFRLITDELIKFADEPLQQLVSEAGDALNELSETGGRSLGRAATSFLMSFCTAVPFLGAVCTGGAGIGYLINGGVQAGVTTGKLIEDSISTFSKYTDNELEPIENIIDTIKNLAEKSEKIKVKYSTIFEEFENNTREAARLGKISS